MYTDTENNNGHSQRLKTADYSDINTARLRKRKVGMQREDGLSEKISAGLDVRNILIWETLLDSYLLY